MKKISIVGDHSKSHCGCAAVMDSLHGILKSGGYEICSKNNNEYEITENLENIFGIGGNGGGEFIAIQNLNNKNVKIILCPFIDMKENNFIEIGNSFSDFLIRLNNGEEWFVEKNACR